MHTWKLEILHFNDVYDIEAKMTGGSIATVKEAGGAARFKTAFDCYDSAEKLVVFSGDLVSPSLMSCYYEGNQMIMPFNGYNVDVSCLGNHELDFGP